jgi:hypothetical protein
MKTVLDFGFREADGLHWPVPPGTTVDGASIPQPLWSLMGGPFEGKYRDASVVHDYYCAVRSADWQSVHLMFYRGMLVSGVSELRAKIMYMAVYFAGPRWDKMVVDIVRLGQPAIPTRPEQDNILFTIQHDPITLAVSQVIERNGRSAFDWVAFGPFTADRNSEIILRLDKLSDIVERENPSLRSLEAAIECSMHFIPEVDDVSPRGVSVDLLTAEA